MKVKVKVTMLKNIIFSSFFAISLRFDLEVKGHMGQGQRSHGSRSNRDSIQRYVSSQQRQVASFVKVAELAHKNQAGWDLYRKPKLSGFPPPENPWVSCRKPCSKIWVSDTIFECPGKPVISSTESGTVSL